MNFQHYLEKLHESPIYKSFLAENKDAYLSGGFFILDNENDKGDQQNLDFYVPSTKEWASFCLSDGCQKTPVEVADKERIPQQIPESIDFLLQDIEQLLVNKMEQDGLGKDYQKMLFSLQRQDSKDHLIGTIFLPKLSMIKFNIELETKNILEFEKKSFFDMLKVKKG